MKDRQPEQKRGVIERFALLSRNVEIMVGAIAYFFGHLVFAAAMAIAAVADHGIAKWREYSRTKKEQVIFQAKPQTA